jgi:ribosomal-protein-alanine N-acetyltransferase
MSSIAEGLPMGMRSMRYTDLKAVMTIEGRAYEFPWTETIFRDCIRVGYHCQVLELQGRIEAYGIMSLGAGEAHILNLCVHPESQGQGLARRMLTHLLELARTKAVHTAFLEVRPSNVRALGLYQSSGFCEVAVRRGYYPGHWGREDALVMAKEL